MRSSLLIILLSFLFFVNCSEDKAISNNSENKKLEKVDELIDIAQDTQKEISDRISNADEAYNLLEGDIDDLVKRKRLTKLSRVYKDLQYDKRFRKTINHAIDLAENISDSSGLAFNYIRLGLYYERNKPDSAYIYYSKASKIYSEIEKKRPFHHGRALVGMAIAQRKVKNYAESASSTIAAIRQFEKLDNVGLNLSVAYSNLGIVSNNLEDYDNAIKYHMKSIDHASGIKNQEEREVLAYNNMGIVYKNQRKYDKAIKSYLKGLEYKNYLDEDTRRRALLIDNLAYSRFLSGKKDSVKELFFKALKIRESIDDKYGISINNLHLAEYYQSYGNDSLAIKYSLKAKEVSKQIDINANLLDSYKILSEVNRGDRGLAYSKAYIQLNDSLVKEERQFRDKIARIQFETEEKEQEIEEKKEQIAAVENQNTIYLLGMLLLVMGITFAIYFFRQRTKYLAQQNQMVQFQASYETETRISKRLHDELGNDIFQVMLQYQNDPHDSQILEKLNTTYARARDISRENNEFDIDESFPEELSDMLKNYTKNGIQLLVRGLDKINWQGFEAPVKITVYRVLQELMTNMQKHSQASMVVLVFNQDNNTLHIKYTDNGVGIDKTQLQSKNGLHNTEKRIRAIDGTLIFESEKEKGFKADIKIPA